MVGSLQAGPAHRWTKPVARLADSIIDKGYVLGEQEEVGYVLKTWLRDVWSVEAPRGEGFAPSRQFPRPSVAQVRRASASYKWKTGLSSDVFHPRWVSQVSDAAIECVIDLFVAWEGARVLPSMLEALIVFIPKPDGGQRPIGLIVGLVHLWTKVRRPLAAQWELDHDRSYFAAGSGRTSEGTVWKEMVWSEWARLK